MSVGDRRAVPASPVMSPQERPAALASCSFSVRFRCWAWEPSGSWRLHASDFDRSRRFRRRLDRGGEQAQRPESATASLTVSASVSKNCTITTAPVTFGTYDSVAANATAPLDGIGTVTVTCTKGAPAKVGLNAGSNAQGTTRRMSQGAADVSDLRTLQGHRTRHRLGQYRRHRPRYPCGAEPEPAQLLRLRTRACGTRRHGRQLHRYRRGDGEFLRGRRSCDFTSSPPSIVALLLAPHAAIASNFTVTPTEVNLSTSATSALVTLRNGSKVPLRFEVTLVSWSEDEHGKMTLNPSSDVHVLSQAGRARRRRVAQHPHRHQRRHGPRRRTIVSPVRRGAPGSVGAGGQRGGPAHQDWHPGVRPAGEAFADRSDRRRLGRERQGADACSQHRQPAHQRRYHFSQGHWRIGRPHVHEGRTRLVRAARRDANL